MNIKTFFMIIKAGNIFNLIILFKQAFGRYKLALIVLLAFGFLNGILEGIGISAIIPLFAFMSEKPKEMDIVSKFIEGCFGFFHVPYTVKFLLLFIIALFFAKAVILFFTNYIATCISSNYEKNTRSALFKEVLSSNWPYLSKQKMGHLDQLLTTDIGTSSYLLFGTVGAILMLTKLIIYILVVVNLSVEIALLALICGLLVFLVFKPLLYRNTVAAKGVAEDYKGLAHFVNESIIGMKVIKSMSLEKAIERAGNLYFDRVKNLNIRLSLLRNITNVSMQPVGLIFIVGIFAFFYKTQGFNFATFAVVVYAINQVFLQIQAAQSQLHGLASTIPYLKNVISYQEEATHHRESDGGTMPFKFQNAIEVKDVAFNYAENQKIVEGINITIKKGNLVGLIGPSGAGKTTVVDLLLRLLQPRTGHILLDGTDISKIALKEWREAVGYVSQDTFLINDTIENNIKFYNDKITKEEMEEAAKKANIYEFINALPDKFSTFVGERGTALSGGQRQRIALARVLARQPEVLILDEATSSLDNESEMLIQRSIEDLKRKTTIIIIAHRLTTVFAVDELYVLDGGRILENGSPQELINRTDSYFYRMYNLKKI